MCTTNERKEQRQENEEVGAETKKKGILECSIICGKSFRTQAHRSMITAGELDTRA